MLESLIDSAYFGKRVLSLGQLLIEIASFMDKDKLRNYLLEQNNFKMLLLKYCGFGVSYDC